MNRDAKKATPLVRRCRHRRVTLELQVILVRIVSFVRIAEII